MPKARQVREYQRQKLLESLMRAVYREEDERSEKGGSIARKDFFWNLVLVTTGYLKNRSSISSSWVIDDKDRIEVARFFVHNILEPIGKFGRSDSEKEVLFCDFLEKVLSHATQSARSSLHCDEISNPERIFNASSDMDEVPLDNP